tara:strand:- start:454 stop:690 length:237 start_codon:yes stop_codon:yes gene_type:complete
MGTRILHIKKFVQVFEPNNLEDGAEVTYSTPDSRKSFHLTRPKREKTKPPVAVESFALDPDYYAQLMKEVEALHSKKT